MLIPTLLSLPADLDLADVRLESEALTLVLRSNQTSSACPVCMKPSSRVHGTYTRTLADLPCLGKAVRVHLKVRRFVCRTRGCPRATFAERFPRLTRTYARRTLRQADALTEVAFAVGGKAGAQLEKAARGFGCPGCRVLSTGSCFLSACPCLSVPFFRRRPCFARCTLLRR